MMKKAKKENILKVVSVFLAIILFVALTLMVLGVIKPGVFFILALVVWLFSSKGIKYIKGNF
jgi:hypothetical protein